MTTGSRREIVQGLYLFRERGPEETNAKEEI